MIPLTTHQWYVGIDPGFKGAIALMNVAGTDVRAWPMPVLEDKKGLDRDGLRDRFRSLARLPDLFCGVEHPQAFPGSFGGNPADNDKFGQQKGTLETMAFLIFGPERWAPIDPVMWKNRLGLDGKTIEGANERAATLFEIFYPSFRDLIRGPRGGLIDGNLDALLITHFLRTSTATGMKSIAETFGKDSVQSFAFMLGGARRKRKFGKRLTS